MNFQPYPILAPEQYRRPSFNESVSQPINAGLAGLVSAQEQDRQLQNDALARKIQELSVRDEYGSAGYDQVFGAPASKPPSRFNSLFKSRPNTDGLVQPLPVEPQQGYTKLANDVLTPGSPVFDPEQYRARYGNKRLKMFQEQEDRKQKFDMDQTRRREIESNIRKNDRMYGGGGRNGGLKLPPGYRWSSDGMGMEAIPGGPAYVKAGEKSGSMEASFNLYNEARRGLLEGLRGTNTGPIMGRIPAFTSGQQVAEGGVAAMAPVLKQLFRVSGEGVFTDRDQQLLLDMIPTRVTNPEAIMTQMENIDNIVRAKLRLPKQGESGMGEMIERNMGGAEGGLIWNGRKLKDTPANREWLRQQGGR